jgi:hypothetical protein
MLAKLIRTGWFSLVLLCASHAWSGPQDLVIDRLKDPESARFKEVQNFPNGNACGLINAKNSFGGYVGFKPWTVISGRVNLEETSLDVGCRKAENPEAYAEQTRKAIADRDQAGYASCKPHKEKFILSTLDSTFKYYKKFELADLSQVTNISHEETANGGTVRKERFLDSCGFTFKKEILPEVNRRNAMRFIENCEKQLDPLADESRKSSNAIADLCGNAFYKKVEQRRNELDEQHKQARLKQEETERAEFQAEIDNPYQSPAAKLCRHRKKLLNEINPSDRDKLLEYYEVECKNIPH